MKFVIEINCGNAAFGDGDEDSRGEEVARIVSHIALQVADGYVDIPQLFDTNGNNVGFARFVEAP